MRPWFPIVWLAGLIVATVGSWLIWTHAAIPDPDLRFGATVGPVIIWALVPVIFGRFFNRRSVSGDTPALREQRQAVFAFLADRGLKGNRGRYSVPFFLVAGPPGSGKSSILEHPDMRLSMPKTIGNTVWWVGQDAVFIETSLGTPDSDAKDVFQLLRGVRPKLPVNGTLLVLSPADLTLADQFEQRSIAQAIAGGLRQLDETLQMAVPVYFLLSRIDLVPGFREFFDRYEPQERAQPWGFSLSYRGMTEIQPPEARHAEIDRGFQDIVAAMRVRHIELLTREADPVRCGHIQGFSAQIVAIQRTIQPVLEALMPEPGQAWKGSLLRGILMTSARQELLLIDALLPELSRRFAMPRSGMLPPDLGLDEEEGHGYFIGGALKKTVMPEAGLVIRDRQRLTGWIAQWAPLALSLILCASAGYFLFKTFDREIGLTARIAQAATGLRATNNPATQRDLSSVLTTLRQLGGIGAEIAVEPLPSEYALGLTGRGGLAQTTRDAIRDLRVNALAPQISALLEADLVNSNADVATLKTLLTVAASAGNAESNLLHDWLRKRAAQLLPDDAADLVTEGLAAIREMGGLEIDPAYAEATRRLIAYKESLS